LHKGAAWLACIVLLSVPLSAVLLTPFLDPCRRAWGWGSVINPLLVVAALFLLTSPFLLERLPRPSLKSVHGGADQLAPLLLLVGVGGSSAVSFLGVFSVCFGDGAGSRVYAWAAISLACMLFYAWRYRRTLI
jgi:hypothetical protein